MQNEDLHQYILNDIQTNGPIPFERFMQYALYAPGMGYYSAGSIKFGKAGDFVTAPEISPLFGASIANQAQQVLTEIGGGDVLEFGAGSGKLAYDVITSLQQQNCEVGHYYILEVSAELKQRQQAFIKEQAPHLYGKFTWLSRLDLDSFRGVIIANEVIDAMPVHLIKTIDGELKEAYVDWQEDQFVLLCGELSSAGIEETLARRHIQLPNDYLTEVNMFIDPWIKEVSRILQQGLVLLIDYGYPRQEYYHPDRSMGTVMCHYRHQAHPDPLINVGLQDITAHVDFTAIAEAAIAANLDVLGYSNQAGFLLGSGLMEMAQPEGIDEKQQYEINQQIKMLTLPSEMGELFKVMALGRDIDSELMGFELNDLRRML